MSFRSGDAMVALSVAHVLGQAPFLADTWATCG
jgi:hypothetical protein